MSDISVGEFIQRLVHYATMYTIGIYQHDWQEIRAIFELQGGYDISDIFFGKVKWFRTVQKET